ncbi:MAG: dihydroxy-acid dehydratase [Mycobacterium sp.]
MHRFAHSPFPSPVDDSRKHQGTVTISEEFRSAIDGNATSYGDDGFSSFLRRAFLASAGYDDDDLDRPIIGIAATTSDFNTCHRDMPQLIEAVKRGILEAGGLPMVFPTISLGEILTSPTSMIYRNLMAMDTEEMLSALPIDGSVLLGGCDKTVPAQLMAAASNDKPVLLEVVGPMMTGDWRGQRLGACTDCRRLWADYRGDALTSSQIKEARSNLATTAGTCAVMGTASTMACLSETLGLLLPGGATPPAARGERLNHGVKTGRRIVEMVREGLTPDKILTPAAFENALAVLAAIGGSTNAIVHLLAVARRADVALSLDDFETGPADVPLLVDCKPSGQGYLVDFDASGGVPALLKELAPHLNLNALGGSGQRLADYLADIEAREDWQATLRPLSDPLGPAGSLVILRGSLVPDGAVLKVSAASPHLFEHTGPVIVIDWPQSPLEILDDPELEVTADHVLILRGAGPVGAGMPEAGALPIPKKLAAQGVRDMVRISDARMSGTSYGTVILHGEPEGAIPGPLSIVRTGDTVRLSVENRSVDLLISEEELHHRLASFERPESSNTRRGWKRLFNETVLPGSEGADLSFL